jgi:hypothetical protein
MGICELASKLFQSAPRSVRALGVAVAATVLASVLTYMPANNTSALPRGNGQSADQLRRTGGTEFYDLDRDNDLGVDADTYYLSVPSDKDVGVMIKPSRLEEEVRCRVEHDDSVQPWLMVTIGGEEVYHKAMSRVKDPNEGTDKERTYEISASRVWVHGDKRDIEYFATQPNSDDPIEGLEVTPGRDTKEIRLKPLDPIVISSEDVDGLEYQLTSDGNGNNFAEIEIPGDHPFFEITVVEGHSSRTIRYMDIKFREEIKDTDGEYNDIGGKELYEELFLQSGNKPLQIFERSILEVDVRTRDYKAMAAEALDEFYEEHKGHARYLRDREVDFIGGNKGGNIETHLETGTDFLTIIDFSTGTARIYEGGADENANGDPQVYFVVTPRKARVFHEGGPVDSSVTSDREALISLNEGLAFTLSNMGEASQKKKDKLGGKTRVRIIADEDAIASSTYRNLAYHLLLSDHYNFNLLDPESEGGQNSIGRYEQTTGQFPEGGILFEYARADGRKDSDGQMETSYLLFHPDDNLPANNADSKLWPLERYVFGKDIPDVLQDATYVADPENL